MDEVDEKGNPVPYDGENMCPRRHIHEDPQWWDQIISAYNAKQDGVLPHPGGLSQQPALYPSIMSIIDSALEQERELEQEHKAKMDEQVRRSQEQVAMQKAAGPGHAYLAPPKRGQT